MYRHDRVELSCHAWGEAQGPYANRLWYRAKNLTRPTVPANGAANTGSLNAHYVDDRMSANQVAPGVRPC